MPAPARRLLGEVGPPVTSLLIIEDDPGLSRALVISLRARL